MNVPVEPIGAARAAPPSRVILAAAPLVVGALAFLLWALSDRLVWIGPLDRAAFGWAVVVPLWTAAPVVGAFAWRRLTPPVVVTAAVLIAALVGVVGGALMWQGLVAAGCQFGPVRTPAEWVVPAALPGLVLGVGFAAASLVSWRSIRAGRKLEAVVVGGVAQLGAAFLAIIAASPLLMGPVCQRPPV